VCKVSRVFEHVKGPKSARIVVRKIKEKKKNNRKENNRAFALSGLGP